MRGKTNLRSNYQNIDIYNLSNINKDKKITTFLDGTKIIIKNYKDNSLSIIKELSKNENMTINKNSSSSFISSTGIVSSMPRAFIVGCGSEISSIICGGADSSNTSTRTYNDCSIMNDKIEQMKSSLPYNCYSHSLVGNINSSLFVGGQGTKNTNFDFEDQKDLCLEYNNGWLTKQSTPTKMPMSYGDGAKNNASIGSSISMYIFNYDGLEWKVYGTTNYQIKFGSAAGTGYGFLAQGETINRKEYRAFSINNGVPKEVSASPDNNCKTGKLGGFMNNCYLCGGNGNSQSCLYFNGISWISMDNMVGRNYTSVSSQGNGAMVVPYEDKPSHIISIDGTSIYLQIQCNRPISID